MKYSLKCSLTLAVHSCICQYSRFFFVGSLHFVSCSDCSENTEILNYTSLERTAVNFTLWGDEGAGSDTAIRQ